MFFEKVFIIFVSFVGSHQIELLDEEHEITEQGRKSGRAVVDMKDACRLVTVPAKVFCSDSNPCLTDKNRASRLVSIFDSIFYFNLLNYSFADVHNCSNWG